MQARRGQVGSTRPRKVAKNGARGPKKSIWLSHIFAFALCKACFVEWSPGPGGKNAWFSLRHGGAVENFLVVVVSSVRDVSVVEREVQTGGASTAGATGAFTGAAGPAMA